MRYDLAPGVPDLGAFPRARWAESYRTALTGVPTEALTGGATYGGWSTAVASYLGRVRSARVTAATVEATAGSTSAARAVAEALRAAGHTRVAVEDPSWAGLRQAMASTGLGVVPVPVDGDGLLVDRLAPTGARAVITTPAHQFPTGAVLSAGRREALLRWAVDRDAVIVEDDYDAEFRHDHRPIASLQGMAPDHVIMLGSVSKTLVPGLRLGWLVRPDRWRTTVPTPAGIFDQAAFADLVERGRYDRQLRLLRRRYSDKRERLLAALARHLPAASISGAAAGMHVLLTLPEHLPAATVVDRAAARGIRLVALDRYAITPNPTTARTLVIGFGNLRPGLEDDAARELARSVH